MLRRDPSYIDGFVRLRAAPEPGEILGGCCVGPQAGELIHEIVAAMAKRMTVRELAAMPHYHPTLAEIWTYPAEEIAERIEIPGLTARRPGRTVAKCRRRPRRGWRRWR